MPLHQTCQRSKDLCEWAETTDETTSFENKQDKLQQDLDKAVRDKLELIEEAYRNIISLEEIALGKDSLLTLGRLDILIDHMKGTEGNTQKVTKLEEIQKRAQEIQGELTFFRAGLNMAMSSAGKAMSSAGRAVSSVFNFKTHKQ